MEWRQLDRSQTRIEDAIRGTDTSFLVARFAGEIHEVQT
jgi:hypothetical protein